MPEDLLTGDATTQDSAPAETTGVAVDPAPETTPDLIAGEDGTQAQTETKDEPAAPVVPEVYEFKTPEGFVADPAALKTFEDYLRSNKVGQEAAQGLVDQFVAMKAAEDQRTQEAWAKHQQGWIDTIRTDKELGGHNFNATVQTVNSVIKRFGSPGLVNDLQASGYSHNPELVRFLHRVGKAMAEDRTTSTGSPAEERSQAKILYPTMN